MENSKMVFFFRLAIVFVIVVALIIILLSVAFIIMSLNVIVQKNRDLFTNLYNIGYSPRQIARYYQRMVSIITVVDILIAVAVAVAIRGIYLEELSRIFEIEGDMSPILLSAAMLIVVLVLAYNYIILRTIRTTVEPKKRTN